VKRFLILCFVFAGCAISAFSQDSKCELPLSRSASPKAVGVPPDLANKLLQRAFNPADSTADQRKIVQDAKSGSGVSGLFCAQTVQLKPSGSPHLFIYLPSFCFSQNCPVWVYGQKGGEYELLLEGVMVGEYNPGSRSPAVILETRTKGYRDIRLDQHVSAFETGIRILKFDGARYRVQVCMTEKCVNGTKGCKSITHKCDTE
jgi:hypothetical protein